MIEFKTGGLKQLRSTRLSKVEVESPVKSQSGASISIQGYTKLC
jgi:hypothetical protein